eukprot:724477-Pyramimonas_sp.AAC.1
MIVGPGVSRFYYDVSSRVARRSHAYMRERIAMVSVVCRADMCRIMPARDVLSNPKLFWFRDLQRTTLRPPRRLAERFLGSWPFVRSRASR